MIRSVPEEDYVSAIIDEFHHRLPTWGGKEFVSLYFGGGTPSLLSVNAVGKCIDGITSIIGWPKEITFEANPEHITKEYAKGLKKFGINRISLGVQSFETTTLEALGRRHSGKEAENAIQILQDAGFEDISVDLIFGHAASTPETWMKDLSTANRLGCTHLSCYELTIEEGTAFYAWQKRGKQIKCNEDICARMFDLIQATLPEFQRYEISNWSNRGHISAHNTACWAGLPYLGLGAGAHSFQKESGNSYLRRANTSNVLEYLKNPPNSKEFEEHLSPAVHLGERLFLALRTCFWFSPEYLQQTVCDFSPALNDVLSELEKQGWIERNGELIRSTPKGLDFHDAMSLKIVEAAEGDENLC